VFRVKLSFPYPSWDLARQTPNSGLRWGDYQFFVNQDIAECDYWFVFNFLNIPKEATKCPKENIVLITAEPFSIREYDKYFLRQFQHIITCQREIKHGSVNYFMQGHPWFVGARYRNGAYQEFVKDFDELSSTQFITKSKAMSIIVSDKQFTDGHKRRFEFAIKLKDHFGDDLELFGRGIKDFEDKWDTLAQYKYSIAIENCEYPDWITEKLYDCFLAHTFPIYHGAPNVHNYFPKSALEIINIQNFDASKKKIEEILNLPTHYQDHLSEVIKAKNFYLNNLNIFPLMVGFIESKLKSNLLRTSNTIRNNILNVNTFSFRLLRKTRNAFDKLTN
jgi:hypothetical protein